MSQVNFNTINKEEIEKFSRIADEWWDPNGKFKPLHDINPLRLDYIKSQISRIYHIENQSKPLSNLDIIDIGCGGGLICEPLSRMGANVTGIDASEKNIKVASLHSQKMNLDINYINSSAEQILANSDKKFDVVLALEIIEHVDNIELFIQTICDLCKNNGLVILTTLNRTMKSYLQAIIGAEYVLRWLPIGTHDWNKFLKPSEINEEMQKNSLEMIDLTGMNYSLLKKEWFLNKNVEVNYLISYHKVK